MTKVEIAPYGTAPKRRKTRWEKLRTAVMLGLHVAMFPAIILHWLLMPLWFVPLHEVAWGVPSAEGMAVGAGVFHGTLLFGVVVLLAASRLDQGRWWWEPKEPK